MNLSTLLDHVRNTFNGIPAHTASYEARVESAIAAHLFRDPHTPDVDVYTPSVILREILTQESTAARELHVLLLHHLVENPVPGAHLLYSMYATVADSALPGCTCKPFLSTQLRDAPRDRYVQLLQFDQFWDEHSDYILAQGQTTIDLHLLLFTYSPIFLLFSTR